MKLGTVKLGTVKLGTVKLGWMAAWCFLAIGFEKAAFAEGAARRALTNRDLALDGTAALLTPRRSLFRVFGDSRYGLSDSWELRSTLISWLLLSPNAELRQRLFRLPEGFVVSADYGLSLPTGSARLLQGYLFPTNEVSGEKPGFAGVPHAGVRLSVPRARTWITSTLDLSVRVPLSGNMPEALGTYAPLELTFAAYTTGYHASASIAYRSRLSRRTDLDLALLGDRTGERSGGELSPLFLGGRAQVLLRLGAAWGLSFGGTIYNFDQGGTRVRISGDGAARRERVRQVDLYPSLDLAWLP